MSSLELSDEIYSSEDEDFIIANMETKSGLPEKGKVLQTSKQVKQKNSDMKMIHSDTNVASVKMSGVIKQGQNLYDSSESEDETTSDLPSAKTNKLSADSRSSSMVTVKSKSSSVTSSVVTINGNLSSEKINNVSAVSNGRHDSVDSMQSSDYPDTPSSYKESRFNPFDRDLHIDEDHFEVKETNDRLLSRPRSSRIKSDSNASSTWTDPSVPDSNTSDDITFADLGLSEDHYSQPEGFFGMSSTEELEMAIETCKELIITAQPHSDKQKNLVKKLVQLRIKLQELKG